MLRRSHAFAAASSSCIANARPWFVHVSRIRLADSPTPAAVPTMGGLAGDGDESWIGRCLHDVNADEYGCEHLSVKQGEIMRRSADKLADQGWMHGWNARGEKGWVPIAFWQELPSGSQ